MIIDLFNTVFSQYDLKSEKIEVNGWAELILTQKKHPKAMIWIKGRRNRRALFYN